MFDQCGHYISLLQDLVTGGGGGMFDQCGYYMSLLVEEACLISVVTIWAAARLGGGMFDQCGYYMSCKTWWRRL